MSANLSDVIVWLTKELDGAEEVENYLSDFLECNDEKVLIAAYNCDISPEHIEECYCGEWSSDEEFTQDLLEDTGEVSFLPHYVHIDWEKTANDIMMDYQEDDGHYFRTY